MFEKKKQKYLNLFSIETWSAKKQNVNITVPNNFIRLPGSIKLSTSFHELYDSLSGVTGILLSGILQRFVEEDCLDQ